MKKKITNFEISTLNYFITRAFLIGITFNALINSMKQDSWIIPILSVIPSIIFILLVNYIIEYEPSLSLPDKIIKLFKRKIGTFIIIITVIFAFFMCTLNYLNLNNFIQSQFLTKTPILAISIAFMLASFYILNKGINTLSRTSVILFYINIILLVISFLGLIQSLKISNIKPFLVSDINQYISGLNIYYSFNIAPMLLITMIPKDDINNPKIKKSLIISSILSAITLFMMVFETLAVFGYELASLYEYAEFHVLKHVSLFGLNSRIESILVMQLLFDIFIFNVLIIYYIANNIKTAFKVKKTNLLYLTTCILIIISTLFLSKYNIYLDNLMIKFIPIIATIFTIIITSLICIKIKISKR